MKLRPGVQLRSAVGTTEVVVVKAPDGDVELTSGGVPMVARGDEVTEAAIIAGTEGPVLLGKRYVDEAESIELLCSKAGEGLLALDGQPLDLKAAKPLPSSD